MLVYPFSFIHNMFIDMMENLQIVPNAIRVVCDIQLNLVVSQTVEITCFHNDKEYHMNCPILLAINGNGH